MNRNAIILIDSDKRYRAHSINTTKERIKGEFERSNGFCWITKGKEIENYLSKNIMESMFETDFGNLLEQFTTIDDFLEEQQKGLEKKFLRKKVYYANRYSESLSEENFENKYDLKDQILKVVETVE